MNSSLLSGKYLQTIATLCAAGVLLFVCYKAGMQVFSQDVTSTENPSTTSTQSQSGGNRGKALNYAEIANWHLFGAPPAKSKAQKKRVVSAPETRLKLELLGIFSDKETGEGWAIISEKSGKQKAYSIGNKLPGNAVLYDVGTDRVTLERNGRHESLTLKKPSSLDLGKNQPVQHIPPPIAPAPIPRPDVRLKSKRGLSR